MIVYVAKCNDSTHKHDAMIVSTIRKIPNMIDSFETFARIKDEKFCIAAIATSDEGSAATSKKIIEWMFPLLGSIRRMDDHPFF